MPIIATSQLLPPESWEEFEDICADLFMLEWGDPAAVRHGRKGQRQHGVDIYGRPTTQAATKAFNARAKACGRPLPSRQQKSPRR